MSRHDSRQIADVKILLKTGVDGSGIKSIEKTGTSGIVDTYTITLDDGTKTTFTVTNGNGIVSIEKTGTSGIVDTYTITLDDGTETQFTVTNGNGIESIEKTQTVGLVDTYTITFTDGTTTTFDVTNGSGGGLDPHIVVTSDHGSTVTLTHGSNVITAVETSSGYFETDVPEYGTWQIDSTLAGDTITKTLVVDTAKVYIVDASHFSATITVTYPSGATCTCVGGGESYTATSNPETFTVHSADTYTITATDGTNTDTETVVISTSGQTETVTLSFVPEGSTVTPTDDIQIWLNCADIFDKSYTTIGEVLADSTTLSALIADSNAVDYMVRSTTWASSVCANQTAMSYIGLDNYCADTLLGDSTWLNAICNSTYFESVLNVKVPTMTSATTPSGTVTAIGENPSALRYKWQAFDGVAHLNNQWQYMSSSGWIAYTFTQKVCVKIVKIFPSGSVSGSRIKQFQIIGSNDNFATSDTLYANTTPNEYENPTWHQYIMADNNTGYNSYKLNILNTYDTQSSVGAWEIQFYGRAKN